MTYESMEVLGEQIETLDNLLGAMALPMPAEFHLTQLRGLLPKVSAALKRVYVTETGDDPWATHPGAEGQKAEEG